MTVEVTCYPYDHSIRIVEWGLVLPVVFVLGAIASGKSSATRYLESRGAMRIDLDVLAKQLYVPGSSLVAHLCDAFGDDIVDVEGRVLFDVLSSRAFCNADAAAILNHIVYPVLERRLETYLTDHFAKDCLSANSGDIDHHLVVVEVSSPRGFESAFRLADSVLLIATSRELRVLRAVDRGMSEQEFCRRDALQPTDAELRAMADSIIENDGDYHDLCDALDTWLGSLGVSFEGGAVHGG